MVLDLEQLNVHTRTPPFPKYHYAPVGDANLERATVIV